MKTVEEMLLSQLIYTDMEVVTNGVPDDEKSKFLAPINYLNKYEINQLQGRLFSNMRNILNTFNYGDIELFSIDERSDKMFRPVFKVTSTKLSRKVYKRYDPSLFGHILNTAYSNALLLLSSQIGEALSEIFEGMNVKKLLWEHRDNYTKNMILTYTFKCKEEEEILFTKIQEVMSCNLKNFLRQVKIRTTDGGNYELYIEISLENVIEIVRCGILVDCDMTLQLSAENDSLEQAVYSMMYDEEPSRKYFDDKRTVVPATTSLEDLF